jgi:hypothetical protein
VVTFAVEPKELVALWIAETTAAIQNTTTIQKVHTA